MVAEYDVVVAGGGMVGASFACALHYHSPANTRCCLIEPIPLTDRRQTTYDDRGLTLSMSSRYILEGLDIWPHLTGSTHPIKRIHISEQGQLGTVRLQANALDLEALGFIVSAHDLGATLYERLKTLDHVDLRHPARVAQITHAPNGLGVQIDQAGKTERIQCRLLVIADGSHSKLREHLKIASDRYDYQQTAIVNTITTERPLQHTAYERFTEHGPIALLPKGAHQAVLVSTAATDQYQTIMHMDDRRFSHHIETEFGLRLGRLTKPGQRRHYPIEYIRAREQYRQHLVLLGNAAHTLHPNAAQGFNLGLRDAAALAEHVGRGMMNNTPPGDSGLLGDYLKQRQADQTRTIQFTRGLASLFYASGLAKRLLRKKLMWMTGHTPFIQNRLALMLTGLWGRQPELVYKHRT